MQTEMTENQTMYAKQPKKRWNCLFLIQGIGFLYLPFFSPSCLILFCPLWANGAEQYSFETARPVFRKVLSHESFETNTHEWSSESQTRLYVANDELIVEALGTEPSFYHFFNTPCNQLHVRFRMKTRVKSDCRIYWVTQEMPQRDDSNCVLIQLQPDDTWHDYSVVLPINGHLNALSIKLTGKTGRWSIGSMQLEATIPHPLIVKNAVRQNDNVLFTLFNASHTSTFFTIEGIPGDQRLEPRRFADFLIPVQKNRNPGEAVLRIETKDFPAAVYPVFLYLPEEKADWLQYPFGLQKELLLEISPDARIARISHTAHTVQNSPETAASPKTLALLAPLVHQNGRIPDFQLESGSKEGEFTFRGSNAVLNLVVSGEEIAFSLEPVSSETAASETDSPPELFEGPVVRVPGSLQGGLLSGVEFLGPGDVSSATIDIAEPNNIRFSPPKFWITVPIAILASDQIGVGLFWADPELQPVFASPNSMDLSGDHRMSLRGNRIEATLRLKTVSQELHQASVPELIHWGITKHGLPPLPPHPRTATEQKELVLLALNGPLLGTDKMSWGYYAESDWAREPYADVLSTLFRLTGVVPKVTSITPGGSYIENNAIYFLTGRIADWKDLQSADVHKDLEDMEADGTFIKRSMFPELEPKQRTSLGLNARKAAFLLDYAKTTGDHKVLEAAEKTLVWMLQADVPRGGFYWETPFHTPDLLAAAYSVLAFTRGFELTQKPEYLDGARRFALLGLPFVYLWGTQPIQLYTTVPMFGGTEREKAWFGTAQPFSGIIYGHAIAQFAPYDSTLDWKRIATGILIAAEQMQYSDGPYAGCLPDEFSIDNQMRESRKLNPCGLVSLQLVLEGKVDSLSVVTSGTDTIASPFQIQENRRGVLARDVPSKLLFEVLINGQQVKSVQGSGSGKDQINF